MASILNNIDLSNPWNWGSALIFLALAFFYGMWMGRGKVITLTLGIYFSFILTKAIPWKELKFLGTKTPPDSTIQIFIFLALILAFYFLIPYSNLKQSFKISGRDRGGWWQVFIMSVCQIGLSVEVIITFLTAKVINDFNPLAKSLFIGQTAQFVWFLLPILALMFLRSSKRHYEVD